MSEAPERITATFKNWRNPNQGVCYMNDAGNTEYVRADIVQALTAERDRLQEVLIELIQHTHNCERELTEDLHHVDFCGESVPLTNAREALKGETP